MEIAAKYDLPVVSDACQAHKRHDWRQSRSPTFGTAQCYSFYPSKNLGGAYGDGGMTVTNCDTLASGFACCVTTDRSRKTSTKCSASTAGLDTLQAAILAVKLRYLAEGNELRLSQAAAAHHGELLADELRSGAAERTNEC